MFAGSLPALVFYRANGKISGFMWQYVLYLLYRSIYCIKYPSHAAKLFVDLNIF